MAITLNLQRRMLHILKVMREAPTHKDPWTNKTVRVRLKLPKISPSATDTIYKSMQRMTDLGYLRSLGPMEHGFGRGYESTEKGLEYFEANKHLIDEDGLVGIFTVDPSYPKRGPAKSTQKIKQPEIPRTAGEDLAINGIVALIDANKHLRGLLARFQIEIANALDEGSSNE